MIYSIRSCREDRNYIFGKIGDSYNGNIFHDKCLLELIHENRSYDELKACREEAIENIGETTIGSARRSLREIELAMILVNLVTWRINDLQHI